MGQPTIDLPSGWTERAGETHRDSPLVECQHTTADGVRFVVSLVPRADAKAYSLHLSTSNPTAVPERHEFPVKDYRSRTAAVAGTESFLGHLSRRLREGDISSADPGIEEVRGVLLAFSDGRPFQLVRGFLSLLR